MSAGIETAGLPLSGRGFSTCALTMPSIVSLFSPISRAEAKASSRLGPISAVVPAWARTWQTPHFWMKRTRPRVVSALVVPQPDAATTTPREGGEGEQRADELRRAVHTAGGRRSLYVEAA